MVVVQHPTSHDQAFCFGTVGVGFGRYRKKLSNMQLGVVIEFDLMLAWH